MNEIAVVTEQDIPDILRMIHEIYSELPNKEWFSLDSDEEVTSYMMTGGFGLKAMCDGRLSLSHGQRILGMRISDTICNLMKNSESSRHIWRLPW